MAFCISYVSPPFASGRKWSSIRYGFRLDPRSTRKRTFSQTVLSRIHSQSTNIPETATELEDSRGNEDSEELSLVPVESKKEALGFMGRIRNWFKMDKNKLQNLGVGAILSYGFISNVNSGICFTVAWLTHVKRTGMMPFAPGQWKGFVAIYAGLWALYSVLRPLRIALAIALTPLVDRMMEYLVHKLGVERRQAFFLLLIALIVFTLSSFGMAVWILGGIPSKPPPTVS